MRFIQFVQPRRLHHKTDPDPLWCRRPACTYGRSTLPLFRRHSYAAGGALRVPGASAADIVVNETELRLRADGYRGVLGGVELGEQRLVLDRDGPALARSDISRTNRRVPATVTAWPCVG